MITKNNLVEQFPNINKTKLPQLFQNDYSFVVDNLDLYNDDDDIKLYINTYINKLNEWLSKQEKQGKQKVSVTNKTIQDARKLDISDSIYVMSKQAKQSDFHYVDIAKGKQTNSKMLIKTTEYEMIKHEIQLALKEKSDMCFRILENGRDHVLYEGKMADATSRKKQAKSKKATTARVAKSKTLRPQGKPIEKLPLDVYYIKRYITMHGKIKTGDQILNLLHSLQKALTERTINKQSAYSKEIMQIQNELINCVEVVNTSATIEIDAKRLGHYRSIVEQYQPMLSVTYLKKYISLNGKSGVKGRAQELARLIKKAVDTNRIPKNDRYAKQLETAYTNLVNFTDNTFVIDQAELNGLQGLGGLGDADGLGFIAPIMMGVASNLIANGITNFIRKKNGNIINSVDFAGLEFETLPLEGNYKNLIGMPSRNFSVMIHGMPGSGKTTWCILFAKYLAEKQNLKVLFATIEEGINHTAQDKINRMRAAHHNLVIADHMPKSLIAYDVVFIDSINSFRYSPQDLQGFRKKYPNIIIVEIFQSTKDGKFKGSQEYEHDVDVVIRAENGAVSTVGSKNRFGVGGTMRVW